MYNTRIIIFAHVALSAACTLAHRYGLIDGFTVGSPLIARLAYTYIAPTALHALTLPATVILIVRLLRKAPCALFAPLTAAVATFPAADAYTHTIGASGLIYVLIGHSLIRNYSAALRRTTAMLLAVNVVQSLFNVNVALHLSSLSLGIITSLFTIAISQTLEGRQH